MDQFNPAKHVKDLEILMSKTEDMSKDDFVAARRITENICKYLLVKNGNLASMDSRFQLSDLDKDDLYESIGCKTMREKFSIKIIQQLGNKGAHSHLDITREEAIVLRKALAEFACNFVPRIRPAGLTKKLQKARRRVYRTQVVVNKRYHSLSYIDAANALEENNNKLFRRKLAVWLNNILIHLVREKYGKVPDEYYFDKARQQVHIYKCLDLPEAFKWKTWVPLLHKYTIGKVEDIQAEGDKIHPSIYDAFNALANEVYKEVEATSSHRENILTNIFQVIMITTVGIIIWLFLQAPDPALLNIPTSQMYAFILVLLGAFMVVYVYEFIYSFIPVTQRGLVRDFSTAFISLSAVTVIVGIVRIVSHGTFNANDQIANIAMITFIWIFVLGITVFLNASLSKRWKSTLQIMGILISVASVSLGLLVNLGI